MRRATLFATLVLVGATASHAQETGSHLRQFTPAPMTDDSSLTPGERAQRTMNAYAACLVERSRKRAEQFVATDRGSAEESSLVQRIAVADCLRNGELRFKPDLLRGGIYEALYRTDFRRNPPVDLAGRAPVSYFGTKLGMADRQQAWEPVLRFADCVARKNAEGVRALIFAAAATKIESAAIAKLQPALNGCLVEGNSVRFSKIVLRGTLAEALYKLSLAPVAPAAGTASGTMN